MTSIGKLLSFYTFFDPTFSLDASEKRRFLQFVVYLAENMGFDFHTQYDFKWNNGIPQSGDVLDSGIELNRVLNKYPDKSENEIFFEKLSHKDKEIIEYLKKLIQKFGFSKENFTQPEFLRKLGLFVSLDFVLLKVYPDVDKAERLEQTKHFLTKSSPKLAKEIENNPDLQGHLSLRKQFLQRNDDLVVMT